MNTNIFKPKYSFFNEQLICTQFKINSNLMLESNLKDWLKRTFSPLGWKCIKVETHGKDGFPDMLLLREKEYWQIETKLLKKKRLNVIEDDLQWQFGQLAYMKQACKRKLNYCLVVGKGNCVGFIQKEESHEQ